MTITELLADIILYGGQEVSEIGSDTDAFIKWAEAALVNIHEEVCALSNKWTTTTGTPIANGYEMALPTDWDHLTGTIELYTDVDHNEQFVDFSVQYGVIRFDSQRGTQTFYIRYRKQPSTFTAMGDTISECANPRLKKIIMEEIMAMYLATNNDLEASNAQQNILNNAARNS